MPNKGLAHRAGLRRRFFELKILIGILRFTAVFVVLRPPGEGQR